MCTWKQLSVLLNASPSLGSFSSKDEVLLSQEAIVQNSTWASALTLVRKQNVVSTVPPELHSHTSEMDHSLEDLIPPPTLPHWAWLSQYRAIPTQPSENWKWKSSEHCEDPGEVAGENLNSWEQLFLRGPRYSQQPEWWKTAWQSRKSPLRAEALGLKDQRNWPTIQKSVFRHPRLA